MLTLGASSHAILHSFDSAGKSEALAKDVLAPGGSPEESPKKDVVSLARVWKEQQQSLRAAEDTAEGIADKANP